MRGNTRGCLEGHLPQHIFRGGDSRFLSRAALTALALFACALPARASARGLDAYDVTFENGTQLEQLARQGFDMTEARRGNKVEVVATTQQAKKLRSMGFTTKRKTTAGATQRSARSQHADGSWDVYRPYFDHTYVVTVGNVPGGTPRETLYEELQRLALEHQNIVKSEIIGRTINNKPTLARQGDQGRARGARRAAPGDPLLLHAARA